MVHNIQHDYFIWEENSYTEQKKNDKNNNESVHCVTTTTTKNDLTQKDWRDITNPKERQKAYQKAYNKVNKDKISSKQKAYREVNKERQKAYREDNKDTIKAYKKAYNEVNKDKINFYFNNRRKTDIQFKLSHNLRVRLISAIKGNYKVGSAVKDLGCSVEELKSYIESKFQPGMSWDNWNKDGWHIDHIKPLASFDLTDRNQLLEACHYTNLQPLWATDNIIKRDKLI
jgi:hypothetical protein